MALWPRWVWALRALALRAPVLEQLAAAASAEAVAMLLRREDINTQAGTTPFRPHVNAWFSRRRERNRTWCFLRRPSLVEPPLEVVGRRVVGRQRRVKVPRVGNGQPYIALDIL